MKPTTLLLSSFLATLRSSFCSLLSKSVAVYPERSEGSHSSAFSSLLSMTSSPTLRSESDIYRPTSYPSPKREGRCSITNPNFITTTSTLCLYSSLSETPINIGIVEKRGLCQVPLLVIASKAKQERLGEVLSFSSLLNRNTRRFILILSIFFITNASIAQVKNTESIQQVWLGYFNQTRFSNKWGMWAEAQLRTKEDFFTNFSQSILRAGLTYYLTDDAKLTAGYAYVNHFPADNHKNISQPEHRTWQQLQWHTRFSKLRLMQWFRLEERWRRKILNNDELASGYNFNYRFRYNFFSQFPLSKKRFQPKTLSFLVNDEVHINFGKQIVNNYFDQNRFFLGFAYHVNSHDNLQFGYMNLFQQLAAGNQYRSIHAARIFYFHNLDLRKDTK